MIFLYKYWFCIYLRTRANTLARVVLTTTRVLFRPQKTYFLLSEGSKSLIITFFLYTELLKNITMLKKLPDHFNNLLVAFHFLIKTLNQDDAPPIFFHYFFTFSPRFWAFFVTEGPNIFVVLCNLNFLCDKEIRKKSFFNGRST